MYYTLLKSQSTTIRNLLLTNTFLRFPIPAFIPFLKSVVCSLEILIFFKINIPRLTISAKLASLVKASSRDNAE